MMGVVVRCYLLCELDKEKVYRLARETQAISPVTPITYKANSNSFYQY